MTWTPEIFREVVLRSAEGYCVGCGNHESDPGMRPLEAHHIVSRAQGVGWPDLHNPYVNGAALCGHCHEDVTAHRHPRQDTLKRPRPPGVGKSGQWERQRLEDTRPCTS